MPVFFHSLRHHREADRVIDRRENADHEQPDADLQRRLRKTGPDRGEPDADKEHDHHALDGSICRQAIPPDTRTPRTAKKPGVAYFRRSP
jgi:hypothetical protein